MIEPPKSAKFTLHALGPEMENSPQGNGTTNCTIPGRPENAHPFRLVS